MKQNFRIELPSDFLEKYKELENENKLSVNNLVKYYKVSPSVIKNWLDFNNLKIKRSNEPRENLIDIEQFKIDCSSGLYTLNEINKKFSITNEIFRKICKRKNIDYILKEDKFKPNEDELLDLLYTTNSYTKVAKHYNITNATLYNYLKNIDYNKSKVGKKWIDPELLKDLVFIKKYNINMLCEEFNTTRIIMERILRENNIKLKGIFQIWEERRNHIEENINYYIDLNKKQSLLDISIQENISIEQLKNTFKKLNIDVVLHSRNKSKGEIELKNYIRDLGFECKSVKKLHNNKRYEIDCFIPDLNIGFEYCGEYWHSINAGLEKKYHQDKYFWAKEQGIDLITIFESEWKLKHDIVKSIINHKLKMSHKIYARNTIFKEINRNKAREFHNKNHIHGYVNSSLNYGLYYKDELVSVISFSKPRFDKRYEYEITRFSSLINTVVIGGFTKLLKNSNLKSIITYADLRFGSGEVYLKSGFKQLNPTPPNYRYFKTIFESRIKYQKHKLTKMKHYSPDKTEHEIMMLNNYYIVYDCGNNKYEFVI